MWKKTRTLLVAALCACMALGACGGKADKKDGGKDTATSAEIASVGLEYELSADGTYYIVTGIGNCKDADVIVPSAYDGAPVKEIGVSAFERCNALTSVSVGANVTKIGGMAFYRCQNLTGVTLGSSVNALDDGAFWGCSALTELIIPSSVTYIGAQAFFQSGVTAVTFVEAADWQAGNAALEESALKDPATAAKYLTDTHLGSEWKRG